MSHDSALNTFSLFFRTSLLVHKNSKDFFRSHSSFADVNFFYTANKQSTSSHIRHMCEISV